VYGVCDEWLIVNFVGCRTPLTAILGTVELIRESELASEDMRDGITIIQKSGVHLLGLIDSILHLVDTVEVPESVTLDDVSVASLVQNAVEHLRASYPVDDMARIRFEFNFEDVPNRCQANEHLLKQIVCNLVDNALKVRENGRTFTFSLCMAKSVDVAHFYHHHMHSTLVYAKWLRAHYGVRH
jgi:signal transduction histidine kinase